MAPYWKEEFAELKDLLLGMQQSMTVQGNEITSRLNKLDENIDQMKASMSQIQEYFNEELAKFNTRCETIEKKIQKMEDDQGKKDEYDPETSLIAFGLQEDVDENVSEKISILIREGLKLNGLAVVRAVRLPSRDERPGLIKFQVESLENKIQILRSKRSLEVSDVYKDVYLKSSKSHTDRLIELNFKEMLKMMPSGRDFRITGSGRLQRKPTQDSSAPLPRGGAASRGSAPRGSTRGGRGSSARN